MLMLSVLREFLLYKRYIYVGIPLIGFHVKSKKGTLFRQYARSILEFHFQGVNPNVQQPHDKPVILAKGDPDAPDTPPEVIIQQPLNEAMIYAEGDPDDPSSPPERLPEPSHK